MQISRIVEDFRVRGGGWNFRGIVKSSICRIVTRACMSTSGATRDTRMRGGGAD